MLTLLVVFSFMLTHIQWVE